MEEKFLDDLSPQKVDTNYTSTIFRDYIIDTYYYSVARLVTDYENRFTEDPDYISDCDSDLELGDTKVTTSPEFMDRIENINIDDPDDDEDLEFGCMDIKKVMTAQEFMDRIENGNTDDPSDDEELTEDFNDYFDAFDLSTTRQYQDYWQDKKDSHDYKLSLAPFELWKNRVIFRNQYTWIEIRDIFDKCKELYQIPSFDRSRLPIGVATWSNQHDTTANSKQMLLFTEFDYERSEYSDEKKNMMFMTQSVFPKLGELGIVTSWEYREHCGQMHYYCYIHDSF